MNMLPPVCLLAITLALAASLPAQASSASQRLIALDNATYSGYLDVYVDLYEAPKASGKLSAPKRYPAQLLFERPDRFRLVLRPGAHDEYRAVAQAGVVRWIDKRTGISGKDETAKITDPLAVALLDSVGELLRFGALKDLSVPKGSKLGGARLSPKTWGSSVRSGTAWFAADGRPSGFQFLMGDGTQVFFSVLKFQQNVQTKPGDFVL